MNKFDEEEIAGLRRVGAKFIVAETNEKRLATWKRPIKKDGSWFYPETTKVVDVTDGTLLFIRPNDEQPYVIV